MKINLSTFIKVGSLDVIHGGAIETVDSNVTIDNSVFDNCKAKQGG